MAGYNWAQGKSNNAVAAEGRGLSNATETAKACRDAGIKGVTSAFIKENLLVPGTGEWHHTSSMYNRTDYFDPEAIIEWLNTDEGAAELAQFKAAKKAVKDRHVTGTVCWVEFYGKGVAPDNRSFTGDLVLRGSRVYFDGRYKSVNGSHIDIVEHPLDIDWVLVRDVETEATDKDAWREVAVLPGDGDWCLYRSPGGRDAELLRSSTKDGKTAWTDGYHNFDFTDVTDQDKADVAAHEEAQRLVREEQLRAEEERRKASAAKREANRKKYAKRDAQKREAKRLRAERAAAWRRLACRNETIQGTITWGPDASVRTFTGEITLRDGEAMFNRSPKKTTRIRFFSDGWNLPTAEEKRRNITITEHPINNENQEAA